MATHVLFALTVWYLFRFLKDGGPTAQGRPYVFIDLLWSLAFVVPHSLLLWPPTRKRLGRWIDTDFYGLFFTGVTCATLLALFANWHTSRYVFWEATGWAAAAITTCFYASWVALFYSLHLTGLGYQTGLTPWLRWLRRQPPQRREFQPRGAYRLLRHPVYLSFLGLIWFTPKMTGDHVVLTAVWTVYIFLGSWLKDRRLEFYIGDVYRAYQSRVAGYPFIPIGPLGRRPSTPTLVTVCSTATTAHSDAPRRRAA